MSATTISEPAYRGRFAPSPTGPLHLGSLVSAVGSYILARLQQGKWFVRIDDLDTPRIVENADSTILRCLEACGLYWDESIIYQSQCLERYTEVLSLLIEQRKVFFCHCSRQEIAAIARTGIEGPVYPGSCRANTVNDTEPCAIRISVDDCRICFDDMFQGQLCQNLARDIGDFVIKRADGLFAYQLAIVIDDHDQKITDIIRGADLINSTPRQIYLQQQLGFPTPRYGHLPVIVNAQGQKLSKQTFANPIDYQHPGKVLLQCFALLGQQVSNDITIDTDISDIWQWAFEYWDISSMPRKHDISEPLDMD